MNTCKADQCKRSYLQTPVRGYCPESKDSSAAAQRQKCSLEQLSDLGYNTRPDCELLEVKSLVQKPFLYFSAAAEGFTGPKQGQKLIQHIPLHVSQCFNFSLFIY